MPEEAPFLVVPGENSSINDILDAPYTPVFDDITPSAIQLTSSVDEAAGQTSVEAIILYTDLSNQWQPVWIIKQEAGLIDFLKEQYQEEFAQNQYEFKDFVVERFIISDREFYASDTGNYIIFSESSLGVENSLRAALGEVERMDSSPDEIARNSFVANTPSLQNWLKQLAQVSYRPYLHNIFEGGSPMVFQMADSDPDSKEWSWQLAGSLEFSDSPSTLLRAIRSDPREFVLDGYIPNNAAAFSIFQLEPRTVPPNNGEPGNELDQHLSQNEDTWREIASSLNSETAFVTFAESGAESTSEYLFLRHLASGSDLINRLSDLAGQHDSISRDGNTFTIQSEWLGDLLGSELNSMSDFFLHIHNDIAILALREGLVESVPGDANRRRVMLYDDDYMMVRDDLDPQLSSISYVNTQRFGTYIQPWLFPQNYYNAMASNLDLIVMTTQSDGSQSADVRITSYQREVTDEPYRERWIFPVSSNDITGTPVLADITQNSRNEVVFSTEAGYVYVLATDGTEIFRASTDGGTPVGPPVIYDWYGNNQNVILQAAGNNIYAWNMNGTILPNFPIELDEEITTPLTIEDVTRNGIAEIVVATADRNLHVLNSRGGPVSGWPQSVNAEIEDPPLITSVNSERSIFVSSENTIHGWNISGEIRDGYPLFLDSPVHGSPSVYENHLLSAGRDGSLYSIGMTPLFSDTLTSTVRDDPLMIQQLQVSQGSLNSRPKVENVLLRNEEGFFREDLITLQSSNGSVFLYNTEGVLRFTKSMGQPASENFAPIVMDINKDQQMDLVSLANFGRIYAWNILTEERLYDLPTSGMSYPLIADLYGDGNNEIIAFTREGLRCWTILETRVRPEAEGS